LKLVIVERVSIIWYCTLQVTWVKFCGIFNDALSSISFIHSSMALQPFVGSWPLLQFRNLFTQTVGLLGQVISPSEGRYLHTEQHKHRINAHRNINALSGIRTHDPSVRASEDSSCLRPRGHCQRRQ
jgi:hypothetical protein